MNRRLATVLTGLVSIASVAPAFAQAQDGSRVLVIVNKTKANLEELYTSPVDVRSWGVDQLGAIRVGSGGNVTVNFRPAQSCMYDLMMVFSDGEKVIRRENVCGSGTLIISDRAEPELPSA